LALNGYNDWFLPSRDELLQLYNNMTVIGEFQNAYYWSSTSWNNYGSGSIDFGGNTPNLDGGGKGVNYHVRPVRYF
jgi:hypothetical protein